MSSWVTPLGFVGTRVKLAIQHAPRNNTMHHAPRSIMHHCGPTTQAVDAPSVCEMGLTGCAVELAAAPCTTTHHAPRTMHHAPCTMHHAPRSHGIMIFLNLSPSIWVSSHAPMRRQPPNFWVSQRRSDTLRLSQDLRALAGKVLRTFAHLAQLHARLLALQQYAPFHASLLQAQLHIFSYLHGSL